MKATPPLPIAVSSRCELMQVFFLRQMEMREAAERISRSIPEGIELNWIRPMRFQPPKNPYKAIASAEYRIDFRQNITGEKRIRALSMLEALMPVIDSDIGECGPLGPDPEALKPLGGRLLRIDGKEEFTEGNSDSLMVMGKMDPEATLHAGKLGFYLYETVPFERYPMITKLAYYRLTGTKFEQVFA